MRVGLIVNPLAGLGGSVGLKGSDGELAARALELGAQPQAAQRAAQALSVLVQAPLHVELLTCAGAMGAQAAEQAGLPATIVFTPVGQAKAGDSAEAARALCAEVLDLLLFVGGDGTAREVLEAVGDEVPVLGVPAGVKMHSAVFAVTAKTAGDVALRFLQSAERERLLSLAEVMDREPYADGENPPSPKLFGYLRVPQVPLLMQTAKASSGVSEAGALAGACRRAVEMSRDGVLTLVGPGTTMQIIKQALGKPGSLLGVAAFADGRCLATDASERDLLALLDGRPARMILTVIGGQGFLFGRGNQQFSAAVIRRVGRKNLHIIASVEKLNALPGKALRVDTGDPEVNRMLAGYLPVVTGVGRTMMVKVVDVDSEVAAA